MMHHPKTKENNTFKEGEIILNQQFDHKYQLQPTIVLSSKPLNNAQLNNAIYNTVEDEILQNNGRQIAEGYNSNKL